MSLCSGLKVSRGIVPFSPNEKSAVRKLANCPKGRIARTIPNYFQITPLGNSIVYTSVPIGPTGLIVTLHCK
jgi:hypothetical protein